MPGICVSDEAHPCTPQTTPDHWVGPTPVTAFAQTHPCELVGYHAPTPVITEYHHSKPVFLQNRLYGEIRHGADLWVCSNCHEAIHAWLYWLLGERKQPPNIGRAARAEAERTFAWYEAERVSPSRYTLEWDSSRTSAIFHL